MLSRRQFSLGLAGRIQLQIGVLAAVVIAAATWLSYERSVVQIRQEVEANLAANITARAKFDSAPFLQAEQNTFLLRDEYLRRLAAAGNTDPVDVFNHWFSRSADGLIRVRPELDDYKHLPTMYIRAPVAVDATIRRQVVTAFMLLREWGPALTTRYYSAYIDLPGIALIMYSPSVNWGKAADVSTNNNDYPPVRNSAPDKNPQRNNQWTEIYWDDKAGIWMLSTITPADEGGKWIATVSQDVAVDELIKRTNNEQLPGTYNLMLGEDNRLIAHPKLMEKIRKAAGNLDVTQLGDPLISRIASVASTVGMSPVVRETPDGEYFLGISRISGPNWYFITVYPKTLMYQRAYASARMIVIGGLVCLLVELILLAWIFRRQVANPLIALRNAAKEIAAGNMAITLDSRRNDELGNLADSFADMAAKLLERDAILSARTDALQAEIHEREQSESALRRASDRLVLAAQVAYIGIWDWDSASGVAHWDAQTYHLYGLEPFSEPASLERWRSLVHPDDWHRVAECQQAVRERRQTRFEIEYRVCWPDGQVRTLQCIFQAALSDDGKRLRYTGVQLDITERKLSEQRILHMATHDALTGLANRTLLGERLQSAIYNSQRSSLPSAVLYIDLDNFKQINDTLGHKVGDELLKLVAHKLSQLVRKTDTLARLGGDEFVVLLPSISKQDDAMIVASKMIELLGEVVMLDGVEFRVTPSIGIAFFPDDGGDGDALLRNADIAMYRAKAGGRNQFQCYTADMGNRATELLRMENAIRHALEAGEFLLYFQPKVAAATRKIVSAEALIRWHRPGHGLVGPLSFIQVAEERGLILGINRFVLRAACEQIRRWMDSGAPVVPIAVNLSPGHFARDDLVDEIRTLLSQTGIDAHWLHLEITEGALLQEVSTVSNNLAALRAMGIEIGIDDFGTGYSSLSYLHRFPVDQLKIDRAFVNNIGGEDNDAPLVSAIIGIAHSLKLSVVAEGVETEAQARFLVQRGCDELQGYHFFRPLPADDFLDALRHQQDKETGEG